MPASVLTAVALVDAYRCAVSLNTKNWLEELFVQLFDLLLSSNLFFICRLRLPYNGLLFLDGILHLAVLLVHGVGEVLNTEHVAMVGEGETIHAVFLAFAHQIGHLRHAVEHGIMRVDVQVGEMQRNIVSRFRFLLHLFLLVKVCLHLDARRLNHIRIGGLEVIDELGIDVQVGLIQHAATDQFEEDTGCGLHVGRGVMGRVEVLAKEQVMELSQTRQLELASFAAGELAELSRLLRAGVDDLPAA